MVLPARSRSIVALVDMFGQATARHVQAVCFSDLSSATQCNRALRRLVDQRYLARIERRLVGGSKGGSGQWVYQLGVEGWKVCGRSGRYTRRTAVDYHALGITETYARLKRAEHRGELQVVGWLVEPRIPFGETVLSVDLYVEIDRPGDAAAYWVEVDMGTERRAHIQEKLTRYLRYFETAPAGERRDEVLWLAPDEDRATELRWIIARGPADQIQVFSVQTLDKFCA